MGLITSDRHERGIPESSNTHLKATFQQGCFIHQGGKRGGLFTVLLIQFLQSLHEANQSKAQIKRQVSKTSKRVSEGNTKIFKSSQHFSRKKPRGNLSHTHLNGRMEWVNLQNLFPQIHVGCLLICHRLGFDNSFHVCGVPVL